MEHPADHVEAEVQDPNEGDELTEHEHDDEFKMEHVKEQLSDHNLRLHTVEKILGLSKPADGMKSEEDDRKERRERKDGEMRKRKRH